MTSWTAAARLSVRGLLQNSRCYSRKVFRRPVRILNENEDAESGVGGKRCFAVEDASPSPVAPPSSSTSAVDGDGAAEEEPAYLEGAAARVPPGFPLYVKKGNDDSELSRLSLDTSSSKKRQKSGLIMLEGKRLIQEALDSNLRPKALFFSSLDTVTSMQLPPLDCTFQKVSYNKMRRWSKVTTPPGLIGFFNMPNTSVKKTGSVIPFSVICDNVRDPGNLGSILRVAASAGCRRVFLTEGCVDLWNEKVLRSAMGSHFHLCINKNVQWSDIQGQLEPDAYIMFADNNAINCSDPEGIQGGKFNESDVQNAVHAPSSGAPEVLPQDKSPHTASSMLPIFPYYKVAYSQMNSIYLVVGGETAGLSSGAFALGKPEQCFRVNIPLLNNVESLNVSSALAILTHEIKRQFELFRKNDLAGSENMWENVSSPPLLEKRAVH